MQQIYDLSNAQNQAQQVLDLQGAVNASKQQYRDTRDAMIAMSKDLPADVHKAANAKSTYRNCRDNLLDAVIDDALETMQRDTVTLANELEDAAKVFMSANYPNELDTAKNAVYYARQMLEQ